MPQIAKKRSSNARRKEPAAPVAPIPVATAGHGYVVGSKVAHAMFGDGAVTAVDGDRLTIKFKSGRERLIVAAFVNAR
jgi:DNA helicase-2/ATP-dependent DNA helicase PcrA